MPFIYPFENGFQRINLQKFPYIIYFKIDEDILYIISVFHAHQDPKNKPIA